MRNKIKSIFEDIIFSIKPKKYIHLKDRKLGRVFLHIAIIAVILGVIEGSISIATISSANDIAISTLNNKDMKFNINNGILSFKNSPYKEEEGQLLLLVDSTKSIDEVNTLNNIIVHKEIASVFLKDGLMIKNGDKEVNITYNDLGLSNIYIDNNVVINALNRVDFIKYIIIPIIVIIEFILLIIYGLIVSVIGIVSNLLNKTNLSYKDIFKLSLYSITIPVLFSVLIPSIQIVIMAGGFILSFAISNIAMSRYIK